MQIGDNVLLRLTVVGIRNPTSDHAMLELYPRDGGFGGQLQLLELPQLAVELANAEEAAVWDDWLSAGHRLRVNRQHPVDFGRFDQLRRPLSEQLAFDAMIAVQNARFIAAWKKQMERVNDGLWPPDVATADWVPRDSLRVVVPRSGAEATRR